MKNWIIEYKEYWFDCNSEYEEQTINVQAETKEEAEKIGTKILFNMDKKDNSRGGDYWSDMNPMVSRTLYRSVEEDSHVFNSSIKEDTGIYRNTGYIDVTKWYGL
jgi:hypothetical protein